MFVNAMTALLREALAVVFNTTSCKIAAGLAGSNAARRAACSEHFRLKKAHITALVCATGSDYKHTPLRLEFRMKGLHANFSEAPFLKNLSASSSEAPKAALAIWRNADYNAV